MATFLSSRVKNLKVGILGYTDSTEVAEFIGNVDIDGEISVSTFNDGASTGSSNYVISADGVGGWTWKSISDVGAITSPGGTDGQIQFNNNGSISGASVFYYDNTNERVGINKSDPGYLFEVNGDASFLGGIRDKDGDIGSNGQILASTGTGVDWVDAAPAAAITGLNIYEEGSLQGGANAVSSINFVGGYITAAVDSSTATITLNESPSLNILTLTGELRGPANFVIDPAAVGDDTGTVEIKGNLTVQGTTFRVYNTYTSATDFERANVGWTTDTFILGTEKGSAGGTARQLELQTDGTTRVAITTTGNVGIGSTQPGSTLVVNAPSGYTGNVLDLQVGGTSKLKFNELGYGVNGNYRWGVQNTQGSTTDFLFFIKYLHHHYPSVAFGDISLVPTFSVDNRGMFGWANSNGIGAGGVKNLAEIGTRLYRDATGIIGQRNGTTPNTFRVYNTYTSATDFERANVGWTTDTFILGTEKGSAGGTARQLELQTDGTTAITIDTSQNIGIGTTPTAKLDVNGKILSTTGGVISRTGTIDIHLNSGAAGLQPWDSYYGLAHSNAWVFYQLILRSADSAWSIANGQRRNVNTFGSHQILFGSANVVNGNSSSSTSKTISMSSLDIDQNPPGLYFRGGAAQSTATTNLIGGHTYIVGGAGASASSGQADGGNVYLDGGIGYGTGSNGNILIGTATTSNVGIGTTDPGYKLEVNGSFAATTKSFIIPHPTKEGYKLRYGSLEGPENGIYVRGRSTEFVIELPEYWTKLISPDSITVNLTPIGKSQTLWVKDIKDNKIYIGSKCSEVNYFYTVFAERADVESLEVEIPVI